VLVIEPFALRQASNLPKMSCERAPRSAVACRLFEKGGRLFQLTIDGAGQNTMSTEPSLQRARGSRGKLAEATAATGVAARWTGAAAAAGVEAPVGADRPGARGEEGLRRGACRGYNNGDAGGCMGARGTGRPGVARCRCLFAIYRGWPAIWQYVHSIRGQAVMRWFGDLQK
jgi:hypothetical protein